MIQSDLKEVYKNGGTLPTILQEKLLEIEAAVYNGMFHLTMDVLVTMFNGGYVTKQAMLECLKGHTDQRKLECFEHFLNGGNLMDIVKRDVYENFDVIAAHVGGG